MTTPCTLKPGTLKLGRKAIKHDSRTLKLARYLVEGTLPAAPPAVDWMFGLTNWGMMLNDQLGDCTIAAAAHAVQVWTAALGGEQTLDDDAVLAAYEQWDGYDPSDPESDQGGVELDVLTSWRKTLNGFKGHRLEAFASMNQADLEEVRQAINLFGGAYIGVALPETAQTQEIWDAVDGPGSARGSWGGHAVFVPKYDAQGFTCITWGRPKTMTLKFWQAYVDEAYALLGADWIGAKGSPAGFSLGDLQADLALIR